MRTVPSSRTEWRPGIPPPPGHPTKHPPSPRARGHSRAQCRIRWFTAGRRSRLKAAGRVYAQWLNAATRSVGEVELRADRNWQFFQQPPQKYLGLRITIQAEGLLKMNQRLGYGSILREQHTKISMTCGEV